MDINKASTEEILNYFQGLMDKIYEEEQSAKKAVEEETDGK